MTCRCPSPSCPIDHVALQQQNEWMRDALIACPKFREDAFSEEGTETISAAQDADAAWFAIKAATKRWLEHKLATAASDYADEDQAHHQTLTKLCEDFELRSVLQQCQRRIAA